MAGRHVWVERSARRRRGRERHDELAAGTCVRSVAAMAYGSCQDAESAPTPAGTMESESEEISSAGSMGTSACKGSSGGISMGSSGSASASGNVTHACAIRL